MNREFRFRVFDHINKTMNEGHSFSMAASGLCSFFDLDGEWKLAENDRHIVMQFTGQYDKNNIRIFEGDIVKAYRANSNLGGQGDIYKVYYDQKHCAFGYWIIKSDNKSRVGQPLYTSNGKPFLLGNTDTEVIGNYYQNQDLFKN